MLLAVCGGVTFNVDCLSDHLQVRPSQDLWETIWPSANFTVLPGGSLQIHRVSTADQGIYTCFDVDGKVSASGELRILGEESLSAFCLDILCEFICSRKVCM